jgi:hypothetical protein
VPERGVLGAASRLSWRQRVAISSSSRAVTRFADDITSAKLSK